MNPKKSKSSLENRSNIGNKRRVRIRSLYPYRIHNRDNTRDVPVICAPLTGSQAERRTDTRRKDYIYIYIWCTTTYRSVTRSKWLRNDNYERPTHTQLYISLSGCCGVLTYACVMVVVVKILKMCLSTIFHVEIRIMVK